MSPAESSVVTAMAITGLSVTLGQIAAGNAPKLRPVLGVGVAGFVLLAAANSSAAPLAVKFSTLIATTAALTSGYYVAAALGRYFSK